METEILKHICANQGAVDANDLMFNLFPGESTNKVINNQKKFILCDVGGQQKVVARTGVRLCRARSCPGACGGLHLCRNFLFTGSCQVQQGRVCRLTHTLMTSHNQQVLKEHELESLSRAELCTLLLQNDNAVLPSICHDYNNGVGVLGRCEKAFACDRLHICETYLSQDCTCNKTHDFYAAQPLKSLCAKGLPVTLILTLRSIYANKAALRYFNIRDDSSSADARSRGLNLDQRQQYRGRGRGGYRGNRGRGGREANPPPQQSIPSLIDDFSYFDGLVLYKEDELNLQKELNSSNSDISSVGNDTDAKSDSGLTWYQGRGRGGNRGNRDNRGKRGRGGNPPQLQPTSSFTDDFSNFDDLDLYSKDGLTEGDADVFVVGDDHDTSSNSVQSRQRSNKQTSAVRGRGAKRGNNQRLPGTRSTNNTSAAARGRDEPNKTQSLKDKTEICMYFIKGYCKHEERCFKAHDKMPYRWQVLIGDQWTNLPRNETIEKDYCDPNKTSSHGTCPPVHFDTMTSEGNKVRRLSTLNSLVKPDFIHTTEWFWYWQDDSGKWHLFGSDSGGHRSSDVNSAMLERKFLDNKKDVVEFAAGSQSYSLSFQDMIQTNQQYGTKRLVSRRPRFVSSEEAKKVRKIPNSTMVPDSWDKTQIPQTGFLRVAVQRTSDEFKKAEALFSSTMKGFEIVQIERIQNKALWEGFQLQKKVMKDNNGGGDVTEKQLFHGTDSKYVDAICRENFDWRICGTHGTAFGKGSYFARDASYSNCYTDSTSVRNMFIARVLVGSYTKGKPEYVRTPPKGGGGIKSYDSCVNDVTDPSVFVVFKEHQIYPEYLLQYKTTAVTGTPVQKPKPIIKPVQPLNIKSTVSIQSNPYQPSTSSYNSSASLNQSSTLAYKTSTSSYQPRMSLNQASTSSYQASTSSYQASTPSYQASTSSYQPSKSSYQPSSPSYQASTSSYQASTPSYQPSKSSYQPSTPSYQASTSSYQPSTSAYRSSMSSYNSSTSPITLSGSTTSSSPYQTRPNSQLTELSNSSLPNKQKKNSDSCVIA